MKESNIDLLHCIKCEGSLYLSKDHLCQLMDDKIEFGVLSCRHCEYQYPIIHGVCIFFKKELIGHYLNQYEKEICGMIGFNYDESICALNVVDQKQLDVALNWSYQWNIFCNFTKEDLEKNDMFGEKIFFNNFIPINPNALKDKNIVVWCGGKGREAYHVAKYLPNLLVVNEIGDEIYGIRKLIDSKIDLLLIRCDMINNPLNDGVADYSICDHALQHVADHRLGFAKLTRVLKDGGIAAINVYSYENNGIMTHFIEPLKPIIHKMPLLMQKNLALLPALIIFLSIQVFFIPIKKITSNRFCKKIPLLDHMIFWSHNSFKIIWTSCFDLIHAPISYHFKKNELENMASENNIKINKITHTFGTTWSMVGQKFNVSSRVDK